MPDSSVALLLPEERVRNGCDDPLLLDGGPVRSMIAHALRDAPRPQAGGVRRRQDATLDVWCSAVPSAIVFVASSADDCVEARMLIAVHWKENGALAAVEACPSGTHPARHSTVTARRLCARDRHACARMRAESESRESVGRFAGSRVDRPLVRWGGWTGRLCRRIS